MRDYGRVHCQFWSSDTMRDVSDDARLLALYLLTCPHGNMAGVFRLPLAYAAEDTGWVSERLSNGFKTLSDCGFISRCERTGWTWVRKHLDWNKPDNPNQWKAVRKLVDLIPDSVSFASEIKGIHGTVSEPLGNLTVTSTVTVTDREEEREKKPKSARKAKPQSTSIPEDFAISQRVAQWAQSKGYDRLADHLDSFKRKVAAKGYLYADWDAAFMEAIREDWAKLRQPQRGAMPQQHGGSRAAGRML